MSSPGHQGVGVQPAKATMADLEQMGAESPSPELLCLTLAQILRVRRNEVALLRLEKNCLRFVFPTELRAAGALPLSGPAVAARTASARSSLLSNSFARVRHASLFETVKLGASRRMNPARSSCRSRRSCRSPSSARTGVSLESCKSLGRAWIQRWRAPTSPATTSNSSRERLRFWRDCPSCRKAPSSSCLQTFRFLSRHRPCFRRV